MKIIRPVFVAQDGGFTRDSAGTYYDRNGRMQTAVANALRVTYDPSDLDAPPYALYEPEATNYSPNSTAQGASSGTPGTLPTGWIPSTNVPGLTRQVLGSNFDSGIEFVDIRIFGTVGAIALPEYTFQFTNVIPAAADQVWCSSVFARVNGGPTRISQLQAFEHYIIAFKADGTIAEATAKATAPTHTTFRDNRLTYTRQIKAKDTVSVVHRLDLNLRNGGNYELDVTVRIGLPQLERDRVTSPIRTSSGAVTRVADTIGTHGLQYSSIPENEYPAWDAATIYSKGDRVLDLPNHKIYESLIGAKGNVVLPVASPCRASMTIDGVPYVPAVNASFKVTSTGVLPSGVTATGTYYVKDITGDTFTFSTSIGGAAVNTTGGTNGIHSLVIQDNLGKSVYNKSFWIDAGASNRLTPFDTYVQSQAKATSEITFVVSAATYVDTVSLLNLKASSVSVSVTHVNDGLVFSKTEVLSSSDGSIDNWYDYFLAGFNAKREVIVEGIPRYQNVLVTVCLKGVVGQEVAIGAALFGVSKDISVSRTGAEHGAKVGIQAFDTKKRDDFGNYTIVPRAFAKRADFTVYISNDELDGIMDLLTDIRSVPTLFLGSNKYNATMIYGYFKSFDIDIAYPKYSICSIQLDGLT